MGIEIAAVSHVGRIRKNNEDAYLTSSLDGEEPLINSRGISNPSLETGLLLAVADGMGGAAAGEIASREGLACLAMYLFGHWARFPGRNSSEKSLLDALKGAVQEASDSIIRYSYEDKSSRGMGTTLTAIVLLNKMAYVSQIGDSRAYIVRNKIVQQITDDQTLVNTLLMAGSITKEQARTHPHRNMITQALGAPKPVQVCISRIPILRGDQLLLCSDGLHGEVDDQEIQNVFNSSHSSREVVELLLSKALKNGGKDNITILVAKVDDNSLPLPKGLASVEIRNMNDDEIPGKLNFVTRIGKKLIGLS